MLRGWSDHWVLGKPGFRSYYFDLGFDRLEARHPYEGKSRESKEDKQSDPATILAAFNPSLTIREFIEFMVRYHKDPASVIRP